MRAVRTSARAGFTLVEVTVAATLLVTVLLAFGLTVGSARDQQRVGLTVLNVENEGARLLQRILDALRTADLDTLTPQLATPASSPFVEFEQSLGYEGAVATWSDPQRIELVVDDGQIVWSENPGTADERRLVWASDVTEYLEGEGATLADDNGNGLVDERGLCFAFEENVLVVRLTLQATTTGGDVLLRTFEGRVFPRN